MTPGRALGHHEPRPHDAEQEDDGYYGDAPRGSWYRQDWEYRGGARSVPRKFDVNGESVDAVHVAEGRVQSVNLLAPQKITVDGLNGPRYVRDRDVISSIAP